jgi:hypothetical protein
MAVKSFIELTPELVGADRIGLTNGNVNLGRSGANIIKLFTAVKYGSF